MVLSMLVGHVGIGKVLLCIIVFECCGRHTQAMRKVLCCLDMCRLVLGWEDVGSDRNLPANLYGV